MIKEKEVNEMEALGTVVLADDEDRNDTKPRDENQTRLVP